MTYTIRSLDMKKVSKWILPMLAAMPVFGATQGPDAAGYKGTDATVGQRPSLAKENPTGLNRRSGVEVSLQRLSGGHW